MRFVISGAPRTKKTHQQIVRVKGRPIVIPDKVTAKWQSDAVSQLQAQADSPFALGCPVSVRAVFYRDKAKGDLVNYMQALADALEKAGVVENDRQILSWDGSRLAKDADNPRIELDVTPMLSEVDDPAVVSGVA